ncbi:hypothetical protein [Streptomyces sp. RP5T]|uniref:hypothetical protein n=1 Tax=Streptomyces sp. RP5T TaxID=2490848 RepID=UPI001639B2F2|nr:hypothetical protein [Streptomyces sp. RP5T]
MLAKAGSGGLIAAGIDQDRPAPEDEPARAEGVRGAATEAGTRTHPHIDAARPPEAYAS